MWSSIEASKSSTYRELKAVFITLDSLNNFFSNRLIKLYTDNQNVVRIIRTGSMKSVLQDLAYF
jgi:ribonuclease HI